MSPQAVRMSNRRKILILVILDALLLAAPSALLWAGAGRPESSPPAAGAEPDLEATIEGRTYRLYADRLYRLEGGKLVPVEGKRERDLFERSRAARRPEADPPRPE